MSEPSIVAFGLYLRDLRERKALSIRHACELTQDSPEPLDKATLSRLERGLQIPSIFKLGPLSRVYGISADALVERMELDREAERRGAVETEGIGHEESFRLGCEALGRDGHALDAYILFRHALRLAPAKERLRAWMNLVTAIRMLGRNLLALHELRALERIVSDLAQRAWLHERMTTCCRAVGDMARAQEHAESAVRLAREAGDRRLLAYALATKGNAAIDLEKWSDAAPSLSEALELHQDDADGSLLSASPTFEAKVRLMLADCYTHLGNPGAARRLILAAKNISERHDLQQGMAYAELLLGRLAELAGDAEQARRRWQIAADVATATSDRRLEFSVEMERFRQALGRGNRSRARASRTRLERLAPWIPQDVPAMREFRTLTDSAEGGGTDDS